MMFLRTDNKDSDLCVDAQADLSLCLAHVRRYVISCFGLLTKVLIDYVEV